MITNKDIRVENGFLIINGDKFPLDGQSPETIMEIVEDNSDTTPTENSTAPITSGGVYTALGTKQDILTFDEAPTENSTNPVESGGVYNAMGSIVQRVVGETTVVVPLSDTYTIAIFGTISVTPISCIVTVVNDSQNPLAITNLTSTAITTEATLTFDSTNKTITITSSSAKKLYVNIYK